MSEIIIGGEPKFENVRNHAYWSKISIDTSFIPDEYDIFTYKTYLEDYQNNPTIGQLAKKKYITNKAMNYPKYASRNIRILEKQPDIDTLQKNIKNKIDKLYPKTKYIREYIIENNRVVLDYVEKSKKYTKFDKLKLLLKRII